MKRKKLTDEEKAERRDALRLESRRRLDQFPPAAIHFDSAEKHVAHLFFQGRDEEYLRLEITALKSSFSFRLSDDLDRTARFIHALVNRYNAIVREINATVKDAKPLALAPIEEETITTLALLSRCLNRLAGDADLFPDDTEQPVRPDFDYRTGMKPKQ